MNRIVVENGHTGAPPRQWDLSPAEDDQSIEGFATEMSVSHGGTISFKVRTAATAYRLDIYRLGYYAGSGARLVATVCPSVPLPQVQPAGLLDPATQLLDCGNWQVSASWTVPPTATSGIYVVKLVREDGAGGAGHIVFVVRDDEPTADLLFQTSDTTWHAYNHYDGRSLYDYLNASGRRAFKVSYNRPFRTRYAEEGANWLFNAEYPMVRWLESNGYDVTYCSGVDTHRLGAGLLRHKAFLSVGHDEVLVSGAARPRDRRARPRNACGVPQRQLRLLEGALGSRRGGTPLPDAGLLQRRRGDARSHGMDGTVAGFAVPSSGGRCAAGERAHRRGQRRLRFHKRCDRRALRLLAPSLLARYCGREPGARQRRDDDRGDTGVRVGRGAGQRRPSSRGPRSASPR